MPLPFNYLLLSTQNVSQQVQIIHFVIFTCPQVCVIRLGNYNHKFEVRNKMGKGKEPI